MTGSSRPQIFVNGKQASSENAFQCSSLEDTILAFESLRSYGGVIFRLEEHFDRLFESAKTIGLEIPKTRAELKKELIACLGRSGRRDVFLRVGVDEQNSYVVILDRKRPAWIYEKGVALKTAVTRRNPPNALPPEAKTSAFFNQVLAAMETEGAGIYESIFLDSTGYVTEATIWNVFLVKGEALLTPQTGILHGVTRQFVIKCAQKEYLPVSESNLTRHDFFNADEAFLTNTSGEIVPIRSLDSRTIGTEVPGPVTKKLMGRFRKELRKELGRK